ncbi:N-acetylglucosamine kinase [Gemmobacter aquaticus]|uniref:N-acetylglucosamine kinase n=1 Tax=Gemmobacter aquaticus TaxID=490185 RepID=A0A917YM30_9RHOB|nr:BadF/BadG/BcrA/BcrD ATPase family protein [Gemmobacter aquaticus]GGO37541.1 N-acetylglucosamine kinase [Gemmobacter aquaticus]
MVLFLGIDGGGTGCRAAIADAHGRILGEGTAGPANVNTDTEGARQNILAATNQALSGTGAAMGDLVAALGLAGANVSGVARELAAALPFARAEIVSDAITAARGALGRQDGIVAAMGTGSVFAVSRDGTLRQYGGRGFVLGDEGSGAVLGRSLLAEALRADDGFAPMTPLLQAVLEEFGGAEGVIAFATRARPVEFAAFAPRVVAQDDPAAQRLFDRAVADVSLILDVLQKGGGLPVVFLGGLASHYAARLSARWETRAPLGTGLDGAVQMARELAEGL